MEKLLHSESNKRATVAGKCFQAVLQKERPEEQEASSHTGK